MLSGIRCVEIETNSYCNRKCAWCPNCTIKRDHSIEMPEELYLKVLQDLKEGDFQGTVSFSRYNEPMADMDLFRKRVWQAKDILANARLVSNTNGDFFKEQNLEGLLLDELSIMDYDCAGLDTCIERLKKTHCRIECVSYPYIYARRLHLHILYFLDWPVNALLVDRGGFFRRDILRGMKWLNDKKPRDKPCLEPMYFIGIDYTGDVTPCCQIRGDHGKHAGYILGNLHNQHLSEIFFGEKAIKFRESITDGNCKRYPIPCLYCQKSPGRYTRANPGISFDDL